METHSQEYFARACACIPGGVNSPVRACHNVHATPLFIKSAQGATITDVDGNSYVDFVLSWGPMILGHGHPTVTEAIQKQAQLGTSYGAPCGAEVTLAEMVCKAAPTVQMVRMVNSGTEATMSALRLARAVTKRNKVVKAIGCYHGHADPFLAQAGSGVATFAIPGTPGVPEAVVKDTLLAPYNDLSAFEDLFANYGNEIACVILEPVAANMGLVLPKPGFLEGIRNLTKKYGALLIFDEVITGFRVDYGGAQKRFGILADITTFGKIIGGGLPVGAFGASKEIMEHIAPVGEVYQAGTLSGNPLAMAAGAATLTTLATMDYAALEAKTRTFAHELAQILAKQVAVQVPTIASMFAIFFTEQEVSDFAAVTKANTEHFTSFYKQMRSQGIYLAPSPFETGMLSFAHSDADLEKALTCAKKVRF